MEINKREYIENNENQQYIGCGFFTRKLNLHIPVACYRDM